MKISELVDQSGVPLSTIKFYLREGLLPSGQRHESNQARYGAIHVERLRLIVALREVAGLSLEAVRAVLGELDVGWEGGDPVGEALRANLMGSTAQADPTTKDELEETTQEVLGFLDSLDWTSTEHERHLYADSIATSLVQVRRYLFPDFPVGALAPYARVAWLLSEIEFAQSPEGPQVPMEGDDLTEPTRRAILSTILFGRIVGGLRNADRKSVV